MVDSPLEVGGREPRVLYFCAAFTQYEGLLDEVRGRFTESGRTIALASEPFDFTETDYYARDMGGPLRKQFFVFADLLGADLLPRLKRETIGIEDSFRGDPRFEVARPLNLDPGYLDNAKVVLASTKDHAHRLYLGHGIHGEVTLHFDRRSGSFEPRPWTYPDYRRDSVRRFFNRARDYYRAKRR